MTQRQRGDRQRSASFFSVLDPGTTTLRLLVGENRDGQAVVWGWGQVEAVPANKPEMLLGACEEALGQAERMAQERAGRWLLADQMVVGLPGAQLRGRAWPITYRRSRPDQPIEERELAGLLGRALRLSVNRQAEGPGWQLVDSAVASLTVDGHGVTDVVGFKGREVGTAVLAALARVEQIDAWCAVAKRLEFSMLTLTAAPVALTAGLTQGRAEQALIVDIGGATTDLIWCRGGYPVALESMPCGGIDLTRGLMQKWQLVMARAEQVKRLYATGQLPAEARPQLQEALDPGIRAWLAEVEAVLAGLNQDEPLPPHLVLAGGGSSLPDMAAALRTLAWSERLHFARHPEVSLLRPTDLPGVVNRTDLGRSGGDETALALAAWAARQAQPATRPTRLLAALCREDAAQPQ